MFAEFPKSPYRVPYDGSFEVQNAPADAELLLMLQKQAI